MRNGQTRICPLFLMAEGIRAAILGEAAYGDGNCSCYGEDCEWYNQEQDSCTVWVIGNELSLKTSDKRREDTQ